MVRNFKVLLGFFCSLTLVSIGPFFSTVQRAAGQSPSELLLRVKQEDDIREIVLRTQMVDWASRGGKSARDAKDANERKTAQDLNFRAFYVSVDKKDPSSEFLKRFTDIPRNIKKVSESTNDGSLSVIDRKTREFGTIFYVGKINWIGLDTVDIEGGFRCGGRCGVGINYHLKLEKGHWAIQTQKTKWNS
jgi:hypothetical protein